MIRYLSRYLPEEDYLPRLLDLPWQSRAIQIFGRLVVQPRLITWAGSVPYTYSGQTLPPQQPSAVLQELFDEVFALTGETFNHVLCNRYRDGNDSIGWHSDNEPELGPNPLVVSVSFGAERLFKLKPIVQGSPHVFNLGHGDVLVMGRGTQRDYQHGIPKTSKVVGERVNLTFRQVQ